MKLWTKEILKRIPNIGQTEKIPVEDKIIHVKFFGGCAASWYIAEYDPETGEMFGFADLYGNGDGEWGYIDFNELKSIRFPPFRLPVERDMHFGPVKFSEIKHLQRV